MSTLTKALNEALEIAQRDRRRRGPDGPKGSAPRVPPSSGGEGKPVVKTTKIDESLCEPA